MSSLPPLRRPVLLGILGALLVALVGAPVGTASAAGKTRAPVVAAWGENYDGQLGTGDVLAVERGGVLAGKTVTAVSAGYSHTCAVASGAAYCWGQNNNGQLGDGTYSESTSGASRVPVAVKVAGQLKGKTVTAISVGSAHSCAIASGVVFCWGANYSGEIGADPAYVSRSNTPSPVFGPLKRKTATRIAVGYQHSCALTSDGATYCWGANEYGQLGDGSTTPTFVPVLVSGGRVMTAVTAGGAHTCGISSGAAFCWGHNDYGQLGNDDSGNDSAVPVPVYNTAPGLLAGKTVTAISAGLEHTCAVATGRAYCWGSNESGLLGNNDGVGADSDVPVAVDTSGVLSGKTISAIGAGEYHNCAVASGAAFCWGNMGGVLGDNSGLNDSPVPVAVGTTGALKGATITSISGGEYISCVVASGAAYCWGSYNDYGQLGKDLVAPTPTVSALLSSGTVTSISAGDGHSCAIAGRSTYCWGNNDQGQLGDGTTNDSHIPVQVATKLSFSTVSVGAYHTCALSRGTAYCWGGNYSGELGNGDSPNDSSVPVAVAGPLVGKTVTAIAAGGTHTCAVADGAAYCWGQNFTGQLGDGNVGTDSNVPVPVVTSEMSGTVTGISAGYVHACALLGTGTVYCWGNNSGGQLGGNSVDPYFDEPVPVDTTTGMSSAVTALSAGWYHTCAVAAGRAYCWGAGSGGQLGDGNLDEGGAPLGSVAPVAVATESGDLGTSTVTGIDAGGEHTCAVAAGLAYCWGENGAGQLGTNDYAFTDQYVPAAVYRSGLLSGRTVTAISSGYHYTLALAN